MRAGGIDARAIDDRGRVTEADPLALLVNAFPVPVVDVPLDGTVVTLPEGHLATTLSVSVSASDSDGTEAAVALHVDGNPIPVGSVSAATGSFSVTLPVGGHVLTPFARDDQGWARTGASVRVVVNPAAIVPPTITLLAPVDGQPVVRGTSVVLSALVAPAASATVAAVEFVVGDQRLSAAVSATVAAIGGTVTAGWTAPSTLGDWQIAALASGSNGAQALSSVVSVTVVEPPNVLPTITLVEPLWWAFKNRDFFRRIR